MGIFAKSIYFRGPKKHLLSHRDMGAKIHAMSISMQNRICNRKNSVVFEKNHLTPISSNSLLKFYFEVKFSYFPNFQNFLYKFVLETLINDLSFDPEQQPFEKAGLVFRAAMLLEGQLRNLQGIHSALVKAMQKK